MLSKSDLLYLCDLNFGESIRETARWSAQNEIVESNDLLLVAGSDNSTATNFAFRLHEGAFPSASIVMDKCSSFFGDRRRSYSVHVRKYADTDLEPALQNQGLKLIFDMPVMILSRAVKQPELVAGGELRKVTDEEGARDFVSILKDSYSDLGMSENAGFSMFATPERILRPHCDFLIVYYNGKPASGAMLLWSHSIAGIYWVGTAKEMRHKGLASACVAAIANEAFARGSSHVILQASKFGEPIYRRLGFVEISRYLWYMYFRKK
jgi:ribosomal protein S18 acetylase RimI-like enzyme